MAEQPTTNNTDFFKAFLQYQGKTDLLTDIFQHEYDNPGSVSILRPIEEVQELYPDMPDVESVYNGAKEFYDYYVANKMVEENINNFDAFVANLNDDKAAAYQSGITNKENVESKVPYTKDKFQDEYGKSVIRTSFTEGLPATQKDYPSEISKGDPRYNININYGEPHRRLTDDMAARETGFVQRKDGSLLPLSFVNVSKDDYTIDYGIDGSPFYRELKPGEYAPSETMMAHHTRRIEGTSVLNTMGRAVQREFIGAYHNTAAGLLSLGIMFDGDGEQNGDWLYDSYRHHMNQAAKWSAQDMDEMEGFGKDWNATLGTTTQIISQLATIMAMGYVTGGVTGIPLKLIGQIGKKGALNTAKKLAAKNIGDKVALRLAQEIPTALMGLRVGALMQDQFLQYGATPQQAAMYSMPYAIVEYISEKLFLGNPAASFGAQRALRQLNRTQYTGEVVESLLKDAFGKTLTKLNKPLKDLSKKEMKELSLGVIQRFKRAQINFATAAYKNKLTLGAYATGGEWLEEWFAEIGQTSISNRIFNGVLAGTASSWEDDNEYKSVFESDGKYYLSNALEGTQAEIDMETYNNFIRMEKAVERFKSGDELETSINIREMFGMLPGLAISLGGSVALGMNHMQKAQDMTLRKMIHNIILNNSSPKAQREALDVLIGQINDYVKSYQVQSPFTFDHYKEDILKSVERMSNDMSFYLDVAQKYGLGSAEFATSSTMGYMVTDALEAAKKVDQINKVIAKKNANESINEKDDGFAPETTIEQLEKEKIKYQEYFDHITNNVKEYGNKPAEYVEKLNSLKFIDDYINETAEQALGDKKFKTPKAKDNALKKEKVKIAKALNGQTPMLNYITGQEIKKLVRHMNLYSGETIAAQNGTFAKLIRSKLTNMFQNRGTIIDQEGIQKKTSSIEAKIKTLSDRIASGEDQFNLNEVAKDQNKSHEYLTELHEIENEINEIAKEINNINFAPGQQEAFNAVQESVTNTAQQLNDLFKTSREGIEGSYQEYLKDPMSFSNPRIEDFNQKRWNQIPAINTPSFEENMTQEQWEDIQDNDGVTNRSKGFVQALKEFEFTSKDDDTKEVKKHPFNVLLDYYHGLAKEKQNIANPNIARKNINIMYGLLKEMQNYFNYHKGNYAIPMLTRRDLLDNNEYADQQLKEIEVQLKEIEDQLNNQINDKLRKDGKIRIQLTELKFGHIHDLLQKITDEELVAEVKNKLYEVTEKIRKILGITDKNESADFLKYWMKLSELKEVNDVIKNLDSFNEIENIYYDITEMLAGKLDTVIDKFIEENGLDWNAAYRQGMLNDYYNPDSNKLDGTISLKTYEDGKNAEKGDEKKYFYFTTFLTYANMINNQGRSAPLLRELINTLHQVQQSRIDSKAIENFELHGSTFEQEQTLLHLLSSINDENSSDYIKKTAKDNKDRLNSYAKGVIHLRGNAGSGKSSQLLVDLIEAQFTLKGAVKVKIIAPTKHLQADIDKNLKYLKQYLGNKIQLLDIQSTNDYLKESIEKSEAYDIIFIDEGSTLKNKNEFGIDEPKVIRDKIQTINKDKKKTTFVILQDDGQTKDFDNDIDPFPNITHRIHGEITLPMAMALRHRYPPLERFAAFARNMKKLAKGWETFTWSTEKNEDGTESIVGVKFSKTPQQVVDAWNNYIESGENAILIVNKKEDIDAFNIPEDKRKNVFTIQKYEKSPNENLLVSGKSSDNVFIAIDFYDSKHNFNQGAHPVYNRSRALLTSSHRVGKYIHLVNKEQGENGSVFVENIDSYEIDNESRIINIKRLNDKYIQLSSNIKTPTNTINLSNRSYQMMNPDSKLVTKLVNEIRNAKHGKNAVSLYEKIFTGIKGKRGDYNAAVNTLYRALISKKNGDTKITDQVIKDFAHKVIDERNKISENKIEITESYPIEKFIEFMSIGVYSIPEFSQLLKGGSAIMSPTMSDGENNIRPFIINVVGYSNGKPIVDIIDIRLKQEINPKKELSESDTYDIDKIVAEAKVLNNMGYLVNNLKYHIFNTYQPDTETASPVNFEYIGEVIIDSRQATEAAKRIKEKIGDNIEVATKQQYFEIARHTPQALQEQKVFEEALWKEKEDAGHTVEIESIYTQTNGNEVKTYVKVKDDNQTHTFTSEEFLSNYQFYKSDNYIDKYLRGALSIDKDNEYYASTNIFFNSPSERYSGSNPEFQTRMFIAGLIKKDLLNKEDFKVEKELVKEGWAPDNMEQEFSTAVWVRLNSSTANRFWNDNKETFKKLGITSVQDFYDKKYHIIAVDGDVDIDFESDTSKEVKLRDNAIKMGYYHDYMKDGNESHLDKIFADSWKGDDYRDILIRANKEKIRLRYQLQNGIQSFTIKDIRLGESIKSGTEGNTLETFMNNLNLKNHTGYSLKIGKIELQKQGMRQRYNIPVIDSNGIVGNVWGDMRIVGTLEESRNDYMNRMIDQVKQMLDQRDTYELPDGYNKKDYNEKKKIIENSEPFRLLSTNKSIFLDENGFVKDEYAGDIQVVNVSNENGSFEVVRISGSPLATLNKLFRILQKMKSNQEIDAVYYPIFSNQELEQIKDPEDFERLKVDATDIGIPQIVTIPDAEISSEIIEDQEDAEEGMRVMNESFDIQSTISSEDAISEIESILGTPTWLHTNFYNGILNRDGTNAYGLAQFYKDLDKAIIQLSEINGRVEKNTPRHEAMHIITFALLKPGERTQIIKQLKNAMKLNMGLDPKTISDRDALEYASRIFENKTYKEIKLPQRSMIRRFFDALMRFIMGWEKHRTDLMTLMTSADNGVFKNQRIINTANEEFLNEENIYNDEYSNQLLINHFGSHEIINELGSRFMLTPFNRVHLPHAKKWLGKNNTSFKQAIIAYWNRIQSEKSILPSNVYSFTTNEGTFRKRLDEMTSSDLVNMLKYRTSNGKRSIQNEDTARLYMYSKMRTIQTNLAENEKRNDEAERVYRAMMQKILNGYNVENILLREDDTGANASYVFRPSNEDSIERDPQLRRSFIVSTTLSIMPMWKERAGAGWTKYDSSGHEYGIVDFTRLNYLLIRGMIRAKVNGDASRMGWIRALMDIADESKTNKNTNAANDYNILNSFNIEYGNGNLHSGNMIRSLSINRKSTKKVLNGEIEGVGMYALLQGRTMNDLKQALRSNGKAEEKFQYLDEKQGNWRQFFDSMYFYYRNIGSVHIKKLTTNNGVRTVEELFENDIQIRSAQIKRQVTSNVYDDKVLIKKEVVDWFRNHVKVDEKGILVDGERITIKSDSGFILFNNPAKFIEFMNNIGYVNFDMNHYRLLDNKYNDRIYGNNWKTSLSNQMSFIPDVIKLSDKMIEEGYNPSNDKEYKRIQELYKGFRMTMDYIHSNDEDLGEVSKFRIPHINDFYQLRTIVSDITNKLNSDTGSRIDFTSDGNAIYKDNIVNYLVELFPHFEGNKGFIAESSSHIKPASVILADRILDQRDVIGAPLIVNDKVNNPIASKRIIFDRLDILDGKQTELYGRRFHNLNEIDRFRTYLDVFLDRLERSGYQKMLTLFEPMGDRSSQYTFEYFFNDTRSGDKPIYIDTYNDSINEIGINKYMFMPLINQIADYYQASHEKALSEYEDAMSNVVEGADPYYNLKANYHYVGEGENRKPSDLVLRANHPMWAYIDVMSQIREQDMHEPVKLEKYYDAFKNAYEGEYDKMIDYVRSINFKLRPSEAQLFRQFTKEMLYEGLSTDNITILEGLLAKNGIVNWSKMQDIIRPIEKSISTLTNERIDLAKKTKGYKKGTDVYQQNNNRINEINNEIALRVNDKKAIMKIFDPVISQSQYRVNNDWHPLFEAIFISNFVGSESIAHLTRGTSLGYKDFTDYIKRGQGLTAPGQTFGINQSDAVDHSVIDDLFGDSVRVFTIEDLSETETLFDPNTSKKKNEFATDASSILNPIVHRLLYNIAGGINSQLGQGSFKTVAYGLNYQTDDLIYHKFNQFSATKNDLENDPYYENLVKVMMGQEMFNMFMRYVDNTGSVVKASDAMINRAKTDPVVKRMFDNMIHYSVHPSGAKVQYTRVNKYNEDGSINDVIIKGELDQSKVVQYPWNFLRLQQITKQNIVDPNTSAPTQIPNIISAGEANRDVAMKVERTINEMIKIGSSDLRLAASDVNKSKNYVIKKSQEHYYTKNEANKLSSIVLLGLDPNIFRKKAIEILTSHVNKSIKPKMSGAFHVQAPSQFRIIRSNNGYFTMSDIKNGLVREGGAGEMHSNLQGTSLKPIRYIQLTENGYEEITDINDINENAKFVKAEGVGPFIYAEKFGIERDMTLHEVMTLSFEDNKMSTYETPIDIAIHGDRNFKETRALISKFIYRNVLTKSDKLKRYEAQNVSKEVTYNQENTEKKFASEIDYFLALTEMGNVNVSRIIKMLPERLQDFIKEYVKHNKLGNENVTNKEAKELLNDVSILVNGISAYYYSMNRLLDFYAVRIPTTNSNMGFTGRLVAFDFEAENTLKVSPKKNILDGSDYDADQLNVFYRSLDERGNLALPTLKKYKDDNGVTKWKKVEPHINKSQNINAHKNEYFDAIIEYYNNIANHKQILQKIDLSSLQKRVADIERQPNVSGNIGRGLEVYDWNQSGNKLPGYFANLSQFMYRIVANKELLSVFNKATYLKEAAINPDRFYELTNLTTKLVNAATDNAKEGGLLGKLNVNVQTSNIITGILFSGINNEELKAISDEIAVQKPGIEVSLNNIEDIIFEILTLPSVINAAKEAMATRSIDFQKKKEIYQFRLGHTENNFDNMLRTKILYGEQVSRMRYLFQIQQDIPSQMDELWKLKYDLETSMGMSLEEVMNPDLNRNVSEQQDWVMENYPEFYSNRTGEFSDIEMDRVMREAFNYAKFIRSNTIYSRLISVINSYFKIVDNTFIAYDNDLKNAILRDTEITGHFFKSKADALVNGVEEFIISEFLYDKSASLSLIKPHPITKQIKSVSLINANEFEKFEIVPGLKEYNFSIPKHRELFVRLFPEYIAAMKSLYNDNKFLQKLNQKVSMFHNETVIEFDNGRHVDNAKAAFYAEEFEKLPEALKQALRMYQLVVYGFHFKTGSYVHFIDNKLEKEFSEWIDTKMVDGKYVFTNLESAEDMILSKQTELLNKDSSISEDENGVHFGRKNQTLKYFMFQKNKAYPKVLKRLSNTKTKYGLISNPASRFYNSYSPTIVSELMNAPGGTIQHLKDFDEKGYYISESYTWHGVQEQNVKSKPYYIANGELVRIRTGEVAKVIYLNQNKVKVQKVSPKESKIILSNSRVVGSGIETIINMIKKSFPNVSINLTNNDDPGNISPRSVSYVHNGEYYLNVDMIQSDTPVHEAGHIVIPILKAVAPHIYNKLRIQALVLLDSNNMQVNTIVEHYDSLGQEDLIEEVISNIIGWTSADKIEAAINQMSSQSLNKAIVATIIDNVIQYTTKALESLKSFLNTLFGLDPSINIKSITIHDLANEIANAIINGKVITNATSEQIKTLDQMRNGKVFKSIKINNFKDLNTALKFGLEENEDVINRMISNLKTVINNKNGNIPWYVTGKEEKINYDINDPSNYNKLRDLVMQMGSYDNVIASDIAKWLNSGASLNPATIGEILGTLDYGNSKVNKYNSNMLETFRKSINYAPGKKYYTPQQLLKSELSHLYMDEFKDMPVITEIAYDDKNEPVLSLYYITGGELESHSHESNVNAILNSIGNYVSDKLGITLKANPVSAYKLQLSMMAVSMIKKGAKIYNIQVTKARSSEIHTRMIDPVELSRNLEALKNVPEFVKHMESENMKDMLDGKTLLKAKPDYMNMLRDWYKEREDFIFGINTFINDFDSLSDIDKIQILKRRLVHLQQNLTKESINGIDYSSYIIREIDFILEAIKSAETTYSIDHKLNSREPMSELESLITDSLSISNEALQYVRKVILNNSHIVVKEYDKSIKVNKEVAKYFGDKYAPAYAHLINKRESYWKSIMAMDKDKNGNEFWTGHIYWTTDETLDPIYAKKAKELNISQQELDYGKKIVDHITDQLTESLYHRRMMSDSTWYNYETRKPYSLEDAKNEIKDLGYRPGALPLMPKTTSASLGQQQYKQWWNTMFRDAKNIYSFFEGSDSSVMKEAEKINQLSDSFFWQFGLSKDSRNNRYGNITRQNELLGIALSDKAGTEFWEVTNKKSNDNMSMDIERTIDYFTMSMIKMRNYESKVMPIISATKILLLNEQKNKNVNNERLIKWLDDYTEMAVQNRRKSELRAHSKSMNLRPIVDVAKAGVYTITMPLNVNVALLSLTANTLYAWVEGISDSIAKRAGLEGIRFTSSDMIKATKYALSPKHRHKIMQIMYEYQLLNSNDYEKVNMPLYKASTTHKLSRFHTSILNWGVDTFSKMIVATAVLIHDGVYDAIELNEDGTIKYDEKLDQRFEFINGKFSEKGKAWRDATADQLVADGIMDNKEDPLKLPYILLELRKLEGFAVKYVTGAYSNKHKALIGNNVIGGLFMMFWNFFTVRYENAFGKHKELDEGGRLVVMKDSDGNYISQFERLQTEGYVNTIFKFMKQVMLQRKVDFKSLPDYKKRNMIKAAVNLGMFLFMSALYEAMVYDEDDDKDFFGLFDEMGVVKDIRWVRSTKYAFESLLVIPILIEKIFNPFALTEIISDFVFSNYGGWNTSNYPFKSYYESFKELPQIFEVPENANPKVSFEKSINE